MVVADRPVCYSNLSGENSGCASHCRTSVAVSLPCCARADISRQCGRPAVDVLLLPGQAHVFLPPQCRRTGLAFKAGLPGHQPRRAGHCREPPISSGARTGRRSHNRRLRAAGCIVAASDPRGHHSFTAVPTPASFPLRSLIDGTSAKCAQTRAWLDLRKSRNRNS